MMCPLPNRATNEANSRNNKSVNQRSLAFRFFNVLSFVYNPWSVVNIVVRQPGYLNGPPRQIALLALFDVVLFLPVRAIAT
jgi:hypothetical protein